jgi:tubulin monoglycylase TTLL3/8
VRPIITENETETASKSQLKVSENQLLTPMQKTTSKN